MVGPAVDRDRMRTPWEDDYHSRLRIEAGCLLWVPLSIAFLVGGIMQNFPWWAITVALGGPLLLLLLAWRFPLADVPVLFVVLAGFGGVGWEYVAREFPPWTVGLVFVAYLMSYEEVLSGLVKLQYLRAIQGMLPGDPRIIPHDDDHLVAKKRIWGYLLATSSSAVIVGGFDSGGSYQGVLILVLVSTFLFRSHAFGLVLSFFSISRALGNAIIAKRRWLIVFMSLLNVAAYGLSLHWLVLHGSAFGGHLDTPWSGPAGADADWFSDLETVVLAIVMWGVATFRHEWTS